LARRQAPPVESALPFLAQFPARERNKLLKAPRRPIYPPMRVHEEPDPVRSQMVLIVRKSCEIVRRREALATAPAFRHQVIDKALIVRSHHFEKADPVLLHARSIGCVLQDRDDFIMGPRPAESGAVAQSQAVPVAPPAGAQLPVSFHNHRACVTRLLHPTFRAPVSP
jgi:hypothetical protein